MEEKKKMDTMAEAIGGSIKGARVIYPKSSKPIDPKVAKAKKIYAEGMDNVIFRQARNEFRVIEDRNGTGALDPKKYIMQFIEELL